MASMSHSKHTEQQTGLKNKTQPYVPYKRLISLKKIINTGLESKSRKKFSKQVDPINRQKLVHPYPQVDFRLKSVRRDNEGHFILIK
jgi:hypothetical protein